MLQRLGRHVRISVAYDDRTPFGSPLTTLPDRTMRRVYEPVVAYVEEHGAAALIAAAPALLDATVAGNSFREITEPSASGSWRIRDEVLFPAISECPPGRLRLAHCDGGTSLTNRVTPRAWPTLRALIFRLTSEGVGPNESTGAIADLLAAIERADLLEPGPSRATDLGHPDLTFLGHNTAVIRSGSAAVAVDPWVRPGCAQYPHDYQPLQLRDVGRIDAAVITMSRSDHFDPGTLLQLPLDARIIIPRLERETILATRMAERLRELGFDDVTELEWWDSTRVKDIDIVALPFHGEQPTDGDQLHPDVRNAGNTYLIRTPRCSAAFVAGSRRDGAGDVRQVAARARRELGRPDYLFAGYRGSVTYPVHLLFTGLARYLPFVPRESWGVRQRMTATAEEAVDLAEIWGATHLVPYGDGGAPWFWQIGVGPQLDQPASENAVFDPFPDRVALAARTRIETRSGVHGSAINVLVMRPGDSIVAGGPTPVIERTEGFAWPYAEAGEGAGSPVPG